MPLRTQSKRLTQLDCVLSTLYSSGSAASGFSHNKVQFSRMVLNPLARPVDVPPEMPPVIGHAHTVPVFRKPEGELAGEVPGNLATCTKNE